MVKLIFILGAMLMSNVAGAYQDPNELINRAERYAKAERDALISELAQIQKQESARFQASGGRVDAHPGMLRSLSAAAKQDVSGSYWQFGKGKNGRFSKEAKSVLITGRGFYCVEDYSGFTRARYSCYYDNGAPYLSFEDRFSEN